MKMKDITGQRFGNLIAIKPTDERRNRCVMWECTCDCGNTTYVNSGNLRSGNSTSCGCEKRKVGADLTGQRIGKLTVIKPTDERRNGYVMWECQCDCGNTTYVRASDLCANHIQSCGCVSANKATDLTGQRFGKLTAIKPTDERRNRSVMWECKCDCGNTTYVRAIALRSGNTTSCGCLSPNKAVDLTGQRFGKLIAIKPTDERRNGSVMWECKCDCGNTTYVRANELRACRITSCGCGTGRKPSDLTGQRFGKLTAIRPTDERRNRNVTWECKCDCGRIKYVSAHHLRDGRTQSCGCLRRAGRLTDY